VVATHLRCHPGIYLEGLTKATNNVIQDSWSPEPGFEPGTSNTKQKCEVLLCDYGIKALREAYIRTYKAIDCTVDLLKKSVLSHVLLLKTTQWISTGFGFGVYSKSCVLNLLVVRQHPT
jgi:hypothetical protein